MNATTATRVAKNAVVIAVMPSNTQHPRAVDGFVVYWATDTLPRGAKAVALVEPGGTVTVLDPSVVVTAAALEAVEDFLCQRVTTCFALVAAVRNNAQAPDVALTAVLHAAGEEIERLVADAELSQYIPFVRTWFATSDLDARVDIFRQMSRAERAILARLDDRAFVAVMNQLRARS